MTAAPVLEGCGDEESDERARRRAGVGVQTLELYPEGGEVVGEAQPQGTLPRFGSSAKGSLGTDIGPGGRFADAADVADAAHVIVVPRKDVRQDVALEVAGVLELLLGRWLEPIGRIGRIGRIERGNLDPGVQLGRVEVL